MHACIDQLIVHTACTTNYTANNIVMVDSNATH